MNKIGNVGGSFRGSVTGPESIPAKQFKPGSDDPTRDKEEFSEEQRGKARDYGNSAGHDETYTKNGNIDRDTNYGSLDVDG